MIRYDTIRSESASPYIRTASKHAIAQPHTTGAPSFCLSTLLLLQMPGYWPSGEATAVGDRRGDRRRATGVRSLKSRVIQQGYCEYWPPNNSSCRCRRRHWRRRRLRVVRNMDFVWGVIIAIKICHDMSSISRYLIRYDISCHRYFSGTTVTMPVSVKVSSA